MGLFSLLASTLGKGYRTDENDIRNTRQKFNRIGYDAGDEDFGYHDQKLENSIRSFQRDNNLKEDGLMRPRGETEKNLFKKLTQTTSNSVRRKNFNISAPALS